MRRVMVQFDSRTTAIADLDAMEDTFVRRIGETDGEFTKRVWLTTDLYFSVSEEPIDHIETFIETAADGDWKTLA